MAGSNGPSSEETGLQVSAVDPDRLAEPVGEGVRPRLPFPVVGIGASAGGLEAVSEFLDAMPSESGLAFVLVQHLPPDRESLMAEILARRTAMTVLQVTEGMPVEPDHVYVIRPGHVLTIREGRLHLGPKLGSPRAANRPIDDFFKSLAEEQRERAICIVMSGMGSNGAAGSQAIKAVGGRCLAQEPESAQFPSMPRHLIDSGYADYVLRPAEMPAVLLTYAGHPYARGDRAIDAEELLRREHQHLREILAVLRTRSYQDFTGYKKPTVLRRIERRMGLTGMADLSAYSRLLRQNPAEVSTLADDLLIHVTGFFRDPESWDALRRRVITPLIAAREANSPIRAWVTACSSGEEAYSLAMLLLEEADQVGKRFDIKVFATDLAERTLSQARAGIYPGGIESEITPERLNRFFTMEDEVYRVRPELRDRVVFAPQNVLQDPPFSRLDIATCRNLLIYLEPEIQQRVLALLHFGLREGGALFLGSNETISGSEDLFEPIDKKARIYRRARQSRARTVDFPLPQLLNPPRLRGGRAGSEVAAEESARPAIGPSIAQLTERTLLQAHTPPAVTVDRDARILYFHGDTRPFLQQPSGEPTCGLMLLVREGLRGAVRAALYRAIAESTRVTASDGWVDLEGGRRLRVTIRVSPVLTPAATEAGPGPPECFVVSFEERGEVVPPSTEPDGPFPPDELRRLRAELQTAIEELQTSNEELKASNEEVLSINEELQSANEELETSKEELQSLNEELTTVNAQLRAKMEEHQSASSDLASLLASTDIAVLFLDTGLKIRRYTPAFRDLVDIISSDVGRPLAALARRFEDPDLDDDARAVLERLVPVEREVSGGEGRHFLRRILPYRTTDNRIDGVVLTFVDITARRKAEESLRESEERFRSLVLPFAQAVWEADPAGQTIGDSPSWRACTGQTLEDWVGQSWIKAIHPDDREAILRAWHEVIRTGTPLDVVYRLRSPSGSWRWTNVRAAALRTPDGRVRKWVGMNVDVTARQETEAALRDSETRYRTLFDAIDEGFYFAEAFFDAEGRCTDILYQDENPAAVRMIRQSIRGQRLSDLGQYEQSWRDIVGQVARTGTPQRLQQFAAPQGRWFEFYAFKPPQAGPNEFAVIFRDVTAAREAEQSLRESEARQAFLVRLGDHLRALTDPLTIQGEACRMLREQLGASRAAYAETQLDGRPVVAVDAPAPGYGSLAGRSLSLGIAPLLPPAEVPHSRGTLHHPAVATDPELSDAERAEAEALGIGAWASVPLARSERRVAVFTVHFPTAHDWAPAELSLIEEVAGRTWVAVERARAESALRASEERLRLALSAARMGIWTWDVGTGTQTRDANLNLLLGLEPVESRQPFADFLKRVIHPDDRDLVAGAFGRSVQEGRPLNVEFRIIRPDGAIIWLRDQGDIFGEWGGASPFMTGACVDITDLKQAETALHASEERLRLILASVADYAIFTLDPDRRVTSWSPGAEALFGYTAAEIIGKSGDLLFTPEDRAAGEPEAEVRIAVLEGRAANERWLVNRAGVRFYASGVLARLGDQGPRGFVKVAGDLTVRKRMEDDLRQARDELELRVAERTAELAQANEALREALEARQELLRRLVTAQEDERRRISRELHDGLGQELTALILGLKALEQAIPETTPGHTRLREVEAIVNRIGRETHDLAIDLRPTALDDLGLGTALATYVARWSERTGIAAAFERLGLEGTRLPLEVETAVYRVVQEALNNVAKHAAARHVSVIVERSGVELTALVEDDGRGFAPDPRSAGSDPRQLGLLGMRERIGLIGGTLLIESGEGVGTTLRARIPLALDEGT